MTMSTDITVPQLGNEIDEAEVTEWLKGAGDTVEAEEPVVVLTTTKASIELEAPVSGTLHEILIQEGELVPVGALLGRIVP